MSLQLTPGTTIPIELPNIPNIQLTQLLGSGAFGAVWQTIDPQTQQPYILKIISNLTPGSILADRARLSR